METGEAYIDTDKDGMADSWEEANGLNPGNPADGSLDRDADGYTNLEEYLNGLMAGLYTEDVPFPAFDNRFQKFYNMMYDILRALIDAQKFLWKLLLVVSR